MVFPFQQSHDMRYEAGIHDIECHPFQSQMTDVSVSYRGERGAEAPNCRDFDMTFNDSPLMSFLSWPSLAFLAWVFLCPKPPQTSRLTIPARDAGLFLLGRFISF
jgi:hypothetical protein